MSFDPGQVMSDGERDPENIEKATDAHAAAIRAKGKAEVEYAQAMDRELLTIYHAAKRAGERMPAEDVRRAISHDRMDGGLYARYLMAKAEEDATGTEERGKRAAATSRQSLLKALSGA